MNVGLISDSLSSTAGGIFEIEHSLALQLRDLGNSVTAWGVTDERWEQDRSSWRDIECRVRNRLGPRLFGYVPGLVDDLVRSNCDLLHLQHLWMYPSVAVHRWHRRTGKPYLVTANGMLEPWTLTSSRWNKRLAAFFYENRMLHAAGCLQANTEKEAADFRAYGLMNPICVIPNGVDLPELTNEEPRTKNQESSETRRTEHMRSQLIPKTLLFLGRLHPKKGLVNALRAWGDVRSQGSGVRRQDNWQFVIAGWAQGGHGDELKTLCRELGLSYADSASAPPTANNQPPTVLFTGPVFGDEKDALLRRADAFILPSFSEGLPMAVLEAWAYGLPVLMTDHCNLPEGFREGAALRIGTDPFSIAEGMRELLQGSSRDLATMGANGRALVEDRFTWPKVAAQMKEVYEWIVGGGNRPGCLS